MLQEHWFRSIFSNVIDALQVATKAKIDFCPDFVASLWLMKYNNLWTAAFDSVISLAVICRTMQLFLV